MNETRRAISQSEFTIEMGSKVVARRAQLPLKLVGMKCELTKFVVIVIIELIGEDGDE